MDSGVGSLLLGTIDAWKEIAQQFRPLITHLKQHQEDFWHHLRKPSLLQPQGSWGKTDVGLNCNRISGETEFPASEVSPEQGPPLKVVGSLRLVMTLSGRYSRTAPTTVQF